MRRSANDKWEDDMNKEQFRAMQAPVKETYKQNPQAALVTTRVTGRASTGLAFTVESRRGPIEAGPTAATGGDGSLACAEEMLLESLIACSGVTLQSVAAAWGVELRHARIVAEGDVDVRGTLGISKDVPVGFREIRLRFELDADAPPEKLDKMVEVVDRYCVVAQTLSQPTIVKATRVRPGSGV
jgi:uncharacterized OsmC-like protein